MRERYLEPQHPRVVRCGGVVRIDVFGKLDPSLTQAVAFALHASTFDDAKEQAAKLFPLPASKNDKPRRVDIGFSGGQVLALRLQEAVYSGLRAALENDSGDRWHQVKSEDSDVDIDLAQVVYIRLDTERHSVGF